MKNEGYHQRGLGQKGKLPGKNTIINPPFQWWGKPNEMLVTTSPLEYAKTNDFQSFTKKVDIRMKSEECGMWN
jgi:hypothetical protein